jgi:hypothetical protein
MGTAIKSGVCIRRTNYEIAIYNSLTMFNGNATTTTYNVFVSSRNTEI